MTGYQSAHGRLAGSTLGRLILILPLFAFLLRLGGAPLFDVDEGAFSEATREMLQSGDWGHTTLNGEDRFDKPILVYWLQAACMRLFGAGEFAARLPSALAIAGVVPCVASIGRAFALRPLFAVLAGVAVATCAIAQAMAHGATADALLLFLVCLTAKQQIDVFTGKGSWKTTLGAWCTGALAFLTKGPPAVVAPLALAIGMVAAGHRPNRRISLAGLAVATWIVLSWAIPALIRTDGRFWTVGVMHHVVDRSLQPFEGHGGQAVWWYLFYVVAIPAAFLPWSPFLLALPHRAKSLEPRTSRLLWSWFGITFAVFTISASKLPHYPLPGFPPLAIAAMSAVQDVSLRFFMSVGGCWLTYHFSEGSARSSRLFSTISRNHLPAFRR